MSVRMSELLSEPMRTAPLDCLPLRVSMCVPTSVRMGERMKSE